MYFGEKVRQLRSERNLTQPQLAQAIGIEQSYLSKLENDKSIPSADIFQAILKAFSIDVAALLHGVDDKQVRSDLRQIPEVAELIRSQFATRIHGIKAWLCASGSALVLGLTLTAAGYRGLLFSNVQYHYASPGVLLPGESTSYFENFREELMTQTMARVITEEERLRRVAEVMKRQAPDYQLLDEYRGRGYLEKAPGGSRFYYFTRTSEFERPQNRWLMLVGALLSFGGLVGFVMEARLRSVRL